jgi:hypothetical protein
MGTLHARRLRGRIAQASAVPVGGGPMTPLRHAVSTLDSDVQPDSVLFTTAAGRATELGDLTLAEGVARAVVAAGGGFKPRLLGNALGWSGQLAEGQTELDTAKRGP